MTLVELQSLLAESRGEWEHLEFKKSTADLQGGLETLCAFLNGTDGRVLFGVTTAGRIVGQEVSDATFQEVASGLRKVEPHAWVEQTRIPVGGSKEVLLLETTRRMDGPYTYDGRRYQRIGNTTSRMPRSEYERRVLARAWAGDPWESQPAEERLSVADLDREEIERTVRAALHCGRLESQPGSPEEVLDRLQLRVDGRLRQAAVVLFAREPMAYYPQCALRLARFKGIDKTEFLDQRQMRGHAFLLLDEAVHFILRNIPIAERIEPG